VYKLYLEEQAQVAGTKQIQQTPKTGMSNYLVSLSYCPVGLTTLFCAHCYCLIFKVGFDGTR
jgi:hypothetical protein